MRNLFDRTLTLIPRCHDPFAEIQKETNDQYNKALFIKPTRVGYIKSDSRTVTNYADFELERVMRTIQPILTHSFGRRPSVES